MNTGIQISSFKPLIKDEEGLKSVLKFMRDLGCKYTQLQWIDKSIPASTVAALLERYDIYAIGAQDKTPFVLADPDYYIDLCECCGGGDLCLSGIPNGDAVKLAKELDDLEAYVAPKGLKLSFHPVKNDFGDALNELLSLKHELLITGDVCQMADAGLDPAEFICAHAGRIDTIHFKDRNKNGELCELGKGNIDFESAFDAAVKAGVKLVLAEQEMWKNPYAELGAGYLYLKTINERRELAKK